LSKEIKGNWRALPNSIADEGLARASAARTPAMIVAFRKFNRFTAFNLSLLEIEK
jgi:hypothetical protein